MIYAVDLETERAIFHGVGGGGIFENHATGDLFLGVESFSPGWIFCNSSSEFMNYWNVVNFFSGKFGEKETFQIESFVLVTNE